jgi:hypothetical protein
MNHPKLQTSGCLKKIQRCASADPNTLKTSLTIVSIYCFPEFFRSFLLLLEYGQPVLPQNFQSHQPSAEKLQRLMLSKDSTSIKALQEFYELMGDGKLLVLVVAQVQFRLPNVGSR